MALGWFFLAFQGMTDSLKETGTKMFDTDRDMNKVQNGFFC